MILNFYLLFYTQKNMYTWYLYHFLGGILPIVEIIILWRKKRKPTKFHLISTIILYTISIFFFSITLIWLLFKDIIFI